MNYLKKQKRKVLLWPLYLMPSFPATTTTKSVLVCTFLQFGRPSATFTYCNGRPRPRSPGCVRVVPGGRTTFSRKDLTLLTRVFYVHLQEVIRRGYTFPPHKLVRDDCRWIMFHNVEVLILHVFPLRSNTWSTLNCWGLPVRHSFTWTGK